MFFNTLEKNHLFLLEFLKVTFVVFTFSKYTNFKQLVVLFYCMLKN